LSGEIVQLGPNYASLVASFRAHQDWLNCWNDYYYKPIDLETLRRIDEEYTAKIMSYGERDLARIQEIRNPSIVAWRIAGGRRPKISDPWYAAEYEKMWDTVDDSEQRLLRGPRICLGTGYLIGIVPPAAQVGDVIVQFWNCDAAIVMRPSDLRVSAASTTGNSTSSFMLVGRADVAEVIDRKGTPGFDTWDEQGLVGSLAPGFEEGSQASGAIYVDLDFRTLQIITASIST